MALVGRLGPVRIRLLARTQLAIAIFFTHRLARLRNVAVQLLILGHVGGVGDRFKFEGTASSGCRNSIIEEIVHLGVLGLLLLRRRVVTLVSVHL